MGASLICVACRMVATYTAAEWIALAHCAPATPGAGPGLLGCPLCRSQAFFVVLSFVEEPLDATTPES